MFAEHFADRGVATGSFWDLADSDASAAIKLGIPRGGVTAGMDACEKEDTSCDSLQGVDRVLYGDLAQAAAAVTQRLADSPPPIP